MYPTRRIASRCPKMFRFLNTYHLKTCKFSLCRHPKIGTFSGVGWRCGGGFLRGRIFVAPLKPVSFGSFLAGQEKNITAPNRYKKVYLWVKEKKKILISCP